MLKIGLRPNLPPSRFISGLKSGGGRAAEQRDELPPFHSLSSSARKSRRGGSSLFFARPGFCHRFIRQEPEIFFHALRPSFDIGNNEAHPLQVVGGLGSTKRLGVLTQSVKDLDRSHAAPAEKIGLSHDEIFAARKVKLGRVGPRDCRGAGLCIGTEECEQDSQCKSPPGHLCPPVPSCPSAPTVAESLSMSAAFIAGCAQGVATVVRRRV